MRKTRTDLRTILTVIVLTLGMAGCSGVESAPEVGGDVKRLHGVWHAYVMEGYKFELPSKFVWYFHESNTITQPPLHGSGHNLIGPEITYTATEDGAITLNVKRETTPGGVFTGTWRIEDGELILEGSYPGGEVTESRFRRLDSNQYEVQSSEPE